MSFDLYDRFGVSVHHSNTFYESCIKIVATQDGHEVCVRDPIRGLIEVQRHYTMGTESSPRRQ